MDQKDGLGGDNGQITTRTELTSGVHFVRRCAPGVLRMNLSRFIIYILGGLPVANH